MATKAVLVIDDDLDFQSMLSDLLHSKGFKVCSLLKGEINIISHFATKSDIILLDIKLPGINGIEISKALRANPETENIPIILVSGQPDSPELTTVNAFLGKPFSLSTLMHKIDELLHTPSSRHVS